MRYRCMRSSVQRDPSYLQLQSVRTVPDKVYHRISRCRRPGLQLLGAGKHAGVTANLLSFQTAVVMPMLFDRAVEFESCTGGKIVIKDTDDLFGAPLLDMGTKVSAGQNVFDGYITSLAAFPEWSALGLIEPLNERIRDSAKLIQWPDVLYQVRAMGSFRDGMNTWIDFLMFDGDFFVPTVRLDLLERHKLPLPNTWDEAVAIAALFDGTDLNGDGIPDYGACLFPGNPRTQLDTQGDFRDWFAEIVYSIWASLAQTGVDGEVGFMFDATTMEPFIDTPAFREAVKIWQNLTRFGIESCGSSEMLEGRCALTYAPPGCYKGMFLHGVSRGDWRPTMRDGSYAEPYRLRPFGTTVVLDAGDRQHLVPCTATRCPYAERCPARGHHGDSDRANSMLPDSLLAGELVNRVPFYWSGGFGALIRESAQQAAKDTLWDFLAYVNSPSTSVRDVAAYSSWLDSWRASQLSLGGSNFVEQSTWSETAYAEHRSVMLWGLSKESNGASTLRLPGSTEYTVQVAGDALRGVLTSGATVDDVVHRVSDGWRRITSDRDLLDQLSIYRTFHNVPELGEFQKCELHRNLMDQRDPVVCRKYYDDARDKNGIVPISVVITVFACGGALVIVVSACVVRNQFGKGIVAALVKVATAEEVHIVINVVLSVADVVTDALSYIFVVRKDTDVPAAFNFVYLAFTVLAVSVSALLLSPAFVKLLKLTFTVASTHRNGSLRNVVRQLSASGAAGLHDRVASDDEGGNSRLSVIPRVYVEPPLPKNDNPQNGDKCGDIRGSRCSLVITKRPMMGSMSNTLTAIDDTQLQQATGMSVLLLFCLEDIPMLVLQVMYVVGIKKQRNISTTMLASMSLTLVLMGIKLEKISKLHETLRFTQNMPALNF